MSPHLLLSAFVLAMGLAVVVVGTVARRRSADVAALLADDGPVTMDAWQEQLAAPVSARLFAPLIGQVVGFVQRLLPSTHLERVRRRLLLAGLAGRLRAEEFVTLQILSVAAGLVLAGIVWDGTLRSAALSGLIAVIAAAGPRGLLDGRRRVRVETVQRELPDTLDLMAICVEAGQGLEGAMQTVAGRHDGLLAAELRHILREMELGVSRRAALEHVRDRLDVPDVSGFIASLIQADVLGNPVGDTLRNQAIEQRRRRRQQVREQANKLPVKMLLPLTFFILPALFIVVLGPAAMTIASAF